MATLTVRNLDDTIARALRLRSDRRYLRMVFRDKPVRRSISRMGMCSRWCHRRMTLNNSMSITPITPTVPSGTWSDTGHFSMKTQALSGSDLNATQHPVLYRGRNAIERMFCRLKDFRRIATRYDKLSANLLSAIYLAATVSYWL